MAGDVDVNSGMFAVTASDGSLAIQTNKFTVAGGTGNTVVAGTLSGERTTVSTLSSGACDAVEHAVMSDGATRLSSTVAVRSDTLSEHAGCGGRRGREQWDVCR